MEQLKFFLTEYDLIINISVVIIILSLISLFFIKNRNENRIVFQVFSIILLFVLNFVIKPIFINTYPLYLKGDCFISKKIVNPKPIEEWHKDYLEKKLEFLVLKVGKENYYVSSSLPSLGDFSIKLDGKTKKSDCSLIYKK